jgi:hypothetical protein
LGLTFAQDREASATAVPESRDFPHSLLWFAQTIDARDWSRLIDKRIFENAIFWGSALVPRAKFRE